MLTLRCMINLLEVLLIFQCQTTQVFGFREEDYEDYIDQEELKKVRENPIFEIDEELTTEINNPKSPETSYEVKLNIFKNLVNYQNRLRAVYVGVHNNTMKKLQIAREIMKKGGPQFLKQEINTEKLKKIFNWDDENLKFFINAVEDIKTVYHKITESVKAKPTPLEIFFLDRRKSYWA